MGRRWRLWAVLGCVALLALLAGYAAVQNPPPAPVPPAGSVRLGPEPGEPVAAYLDRLPALLLATGTSAPALVQFGTEQPVAAALAAVAGTTPRLVVLRVVLPRVQTALRFEELRSGVAPDAALQDARERARAAAEADATRLSGRPRAAAAAEATRLADPGGSTVLALVVDGSREALQALTTRPGVRAVEAAPAGTTVRELALSPLLPEQAQRADPLPDDGPIPQ